MGKKAVRKLYTKLISGFEVEFDCPEEERGALEDKLNLITLGNGKDLCIISCDKSGCKAAKLRVRNYNNVNKDMLKNGGIEIESDYTSLLVNNCCGAYHVHGESLHFTFEEKQLLVRIRHTKK